MESGKLIYDEGWSVTRELIELPKFIHPRNGKEFKSRNPKIYTNFIFRTVIVKPFKNINKYEGKIINYTTYKEGYKLFAELDIFEFKFEKFYENW